MSVPETEVARLETGPVTGEPYEAPDVQRLGAAEALTAGVSNSGFGDVTSLIT